MIEVGDPVIITDAEGLEQYKIKEGDKGWASNVVSMPDGQHLVFFTPDDIRACFVMTSDRMKVDEERKELKGD